MDGASAPAGAGRVTLRGQYTRPRHAHTVSLESRIVRAVHHAAVCCGTVSVTVLSIKSVEVPSSLGSCQCGCHAPNLGGGAEPAGILRRRLRTRAPVGRLRVQKGGPEKPVAGPRCRLGLPSSDDSRRRESRV
eukprot:819037-Prymnesium_polylepis.1